MVTEASPEEVLELGMDSEVLRDRLVRGQAAGTTETDNKPTRMLMVLSAQGKNNCYLSFALNFSTSENLNFEANNLCIKVILLKTLLKFKMTF